MSHDLALRATQLITPAGPRAATVVVNGGRIDSVLPHDADVDAARVVDVPADCVLLPGLVDTHVHINEPGRTSWEGFNTATQAAAAGGITTLLDMPLNSIPATVDAPALATKRAAAQGQCHVDVGFWGGAIPGNLGELAGLSQAGVFGFKCFLLDSGVAEFPALATSDLVPYLRQLAALDAMMIFHAEDESLISEPVDGGYLAFLTSRPPAAEERAIQSVIDAARQTGARVHIVHLSDAGALPLIAAARADGVRLTVETCPHYLTFDAAEIAEDATQFKCCPPIRDAENRERLWQGLADGLIDFVVSDHSPCLPSLKAGGFDNAWGGIASLQLTLPVIWTGAAARGFALTDVVRWMAAAPAAFAGLAGKGTIAPGLDADFTVFAPADTFLVDARTLRHRNPITPYDRLTLSGVVRETWLRGEMISFDRPAGRLLHKSGARG